MQVFGALQNASIEVVTQPTQSVQGRFYVNIATNNVEVDDGTVKRALLRNDGRAIIGTDSTQANNVRFHHAGQGLLQFVVGSDTTAENQVSTTLAQVGLRVPNLASDPAPGNIGRLYYNTTGGGLRVETASGFFQASTLTGSETLINKTLSNPLVDVIVGQDQTNTPTTPTSGTKLYTKGGTLYKLATDGVESIVGAGGNLTAFVTKTASYTAAATDGVAFISASAGAVTVTLPAANANAGVRLVFYKTDTSINIITIGTVATVSAIGDQVTILSNGTNWFVIDRAITPSCATYALSSNTAIAANAILNFPVRIEDDEVLVTNGVFTAKYNGRYRVTYLGQSNVQAYIYSKRAGNAYSYLGITNSGVGTGGCNVRLQAGQTFAIYTDTAATFVGANANGGYLAQWTIERTNA